ncbi:restriction endonuclease subunit S [Bacteroides xylanisolvens]|uniref:restriction endonuclease subunit S n=1 Tax=Bacteroides xylanisolvens TaxID=371601 RepID=UPI00189C1BB0|nr:restriction endonuclease subunit S [Bacteroides xylanisolvens]
MKRYEEYKHTDIPWLDCIPSHWDAKRAKYLFNKENRQIADGDEVITCFRDGVVTLRKNRRTTGFTESFKEIGYQGIKKGDLVIHQMDAFAGSTGVSDSDGKGTPVYSVCTPKNERLLTQYYAKVIRYMGLNGFIQSLYRGIRERSSDFRFETFAKQILPIPPFAEQEKIVSYLESKTLCIDAYVRERERELQLLNELKEAEIANVITRGLNPDVRMKDSGIPWIGLIPEHWEIKQLRSYLKMITIKNKPNEQLLSVVREKGVIIRDIESKEENHNYIPDDLSGYKYVSVGQFVINKMKAWQGSYAVSKYNGIVSPAYYVCELNFPHKEFFNIAIRSKFYVPFFTQYSKGIRVGQWDLSPIGLKSIPFFEPPHEEQQAIVAYIEDKCNKINSLIGELEAEIEYLKEYKQKLIADCVTGQINVQSEI